MDEYIAAGFTPENPWTAFFNPKNPKVKRVLNVDLVHILSHESVVRCVKFSADGKYLATGCNRTAQIYDTKTGQKICVLAHESAGEGNLFIRCLCFSPCGKFLATGAEDGHVRIWDIDRKRIRNVFEGHQQEIYSVVISLDGRLIISSSGDKTIRIWDMYNGTSKVITVHNPLNGWTGVTFVAISPNGKFVAAGDFDTAVRIWDVATANLLETLRGHTGGIYALAFTPDGKGLISGSLDKTLKYWDVNDLVVWDKGRPGRSSISADAVVSKKRKRGNKSSLSVVGGSRCTMDFTGHRDYVLSVAISHDGAWVVSGSKDRGVHFWDSTNASLQCILQGHKNSVIPIDLSPAGNILATGSGDWQARIWSFDAVTTATAAGGMGPGIPPSPSLHGGVPSYDTATAGGSQYDDGLPLMATTTTGFTSFPDEFDVQNIPPELKEGGSDWFAVFNPKVRKVLDVSLVHTLMHESVVCCVKFSADGKYLATGCNRTAQIYDTKTGQKICVLADDCAGKSGDLYIRSVCFSPDGKYLATGAEDMQIRIWDIAKKRIRNVFDGHQQAIYSLVFSLDGRLLVSGSGDNIVRIWDMRDGTSKILINLLSGDAGVTSVAISPNGQFVAAGNLDTVVRIWDVATAVLVERLRGHRDSVYGVAFTPDGKGLVSGSLDKTLKYWDVSDLVAGGSASGVKGKKEGENGGVVNGPGGSSGSAGSSSAVVRKDGGSQCTMNFTGHKDYVLSVAVSHDGVWVVSGSKDRGVQFWDSRNAIVQCMLQGHKNSVISIDLSPAGNILATGGGDWQARIWSYVTV